MLTAPTLGQIESIVHERIRAILAERAEEVARLSGSEKLSATLGLSSLDLALLVAELEAQLGVDPFAKLVSITSVRSVDDLVRAYQQAFFPELERREDHAITAAVSNELRPGERGPRGDDGRQQFRRCCDCRHRLPFSRRWPIPRCFGKISATAWNRSAR